MLEDGAVKMKVAYNFVDLLVEKVSFHVDTD